MREEATACSEASVVREADESCGAGDPASESSTTSKSIRSLEGPAAASSRSSSSSLTADVDVAVGGANSSGVILLAVARELLRLPLAATTFFPLPSPATFEPNLPLLSLPSARFPSPAPAPPPPAPAPPPLEMESSNG